MKQALKSISLSSEVFTMSGKKGNSEFKGLDFCIKHLSKIVKSIYIFRARKGEIVAASVTFFALMGLLPMALLTISIYAEIIGDINQASNQMMGALKDSIPNLAPWIFSSIKSIIQTHLLKASFYNWINIALLIFVGLEFSHSLIFGINTIAAHEPKKGVLLEDLKSFAGGASIGLYIVLFLFLTSNSQIVWSYIDKASWAGNGMKILLKYNIFQCILSLLFFTLFYKFISPLKVKLGNAFEGAISFVTMFIIGKTFYWVYLHYMESDLSENFGNFYTMIVAIIWIYYLLCAFFFGACICFSENDNFKSEKNLI